ncbi:MAG: hypothetical protein FJ291_33460 [Planctomycetes bacterium]|nr:hypothetical protein [Planctomycetota bacterium]
MQGGCADQGRAVPAAGKNTAGYFLMIGEPSGFRFVGPDQADVSVSESDEAWDGLDFARL